ncbi:Uncharacterised protein [Bordetella pertussis]|nr:Uncharacterised protein [Bordetella pertussis]
MRSVDLHGGLAAQGGRARGREAAGALQRAVVQRQRPSAKIGVAGYLQRTGIDGRAAILLIGSAQQQGPLAFLHQGAGAADFAVPTEYLGGCDVYAFVSSERQCTRGREAVRGGQLAVLERQRAGTQAGIMRRPQRSVVDLRTAAIRIGRVLQHQRAALGHQFAGAANLALPGRGCSRLDDQRLRPGIERQAAIDDDGFLEGEGAALELYRTTCATQVVGRRYAEAARLHHHLAGMGVVARQRQVAAAALDDAPGPAQHAGVGGIAVLRELNRAGVADGLHGAGGIYVRRSAGGHLQHAALGGAAVIAAQDQRAALHLDRGLEVVVVAADLAIQGPGSSLLLGDRAEVADCAAQRAVAGFQRQAVVAAATVQGSGDGRAAVEYDAVVASLELHVADDASVGMIAYRHASARGTVVPRAADGVGVAAIEHCFDSPVVIDGIGRIGGIGSDPDCRGIIGPDRAMVGDGIAGA